MNDAVMVVLTTIPESVNEQGVLIMKEITRINHVGLRVSSLERARDFYAKLGFEFIIGPVGPEPVAIMEHPSGVNINFILNASETSTLNVLMDVAEKHTGYTHIALEVTDLESAQTYLESINYPITEGPIVTPDGASFIFIRDPDDNVIEFHKPAP
jgi:lactoylglutathione lyase